MKTIKKFNTFKSNVIFGFFQFKSEQTLQVSWSLAALRYIHRSSAATVATRARSHVRTYSIIIISLPCQSDRESVDGIRVCWASVYTTDVLHYNVHCCIIHHVCLTRRSKLYYAYSSKRVHGGGAQRYVMQNARKRNLNFAREKKESSVLVQSRRQKWRAVFFVAQKRVSYIMYTSARYCHLWMCSVVRVSVTKYNILHIIRYVLFRGLTRTLGFAGQVANRIKTEVGKRDLRIPIHSLKTIVNKSHHNHYQVPQLLTIPILIKRPYVC